MPAKILTEFLESQHVEYVNIKHEPAYTAQEIAALAHVPGKEMAKTVMVKIDGDLAMAVLPAHRKLNLEDLRLASGVNDVQFAREEDFRDRFPDCEPGAMPPFGNLYGMDVYMDDTLLEDEMIAFNSGTHTELTRMAFKDFEKLVHAKVAHFSIGPGR
jgi:Ala-tRNA(Pro) deacylase